MMARSASLFAPLLLASTLLGAVGCGSPPELSGTVKDIWGKPIEGATVQIEGVTQQQKSDKSGRFTVEVTPGAHRVMAGKEGFIKSIVAVTVPEEEGETPLTTELALYPEPADHGFYAVGHAGYEPIEAEILQTVGTSIRAYTGLAGVGKSVAPSKEALRFVFSSGMRSSEIKRLDLQLHRITFVDVTKVPGVLGEEEVKVNLWVGAETIPFTIEALPSRDDFLIATKEPLTAGFYAFNTQGLITSADVAALTTVPKEMQEAWPFEVK
jgi:hypothetical protein